MSSYVKYTQQCDVCFVVLGDATHRLQPGAEHHKGKKK